jgi:ribonuclease VapC
MPMAKPATGTSVVFDASAVLVLLFAEPGAEVAGRYLRDGIISAANLAEVLAKLADHGLPLPEAIRAVAMLGLEVVPLTEAQAQRSAELRPVTRALGLSLGDRACLALAADRGLPALTADRAWAELKSAVEVVVLR